MQCRGKLPIDRVVELLAAAEGAPECPACMLPLKPDVVLFGELLPERALADAQALAFDADLMLCVGSSLEVYPVAGLPAMTSGAGGRLALDHAGADPVRQRRRGQAGGRRGRRAAGSARRAVSEVLLFHHAQGLTEGVLRVRGRAACRRPHRSCA